MEGRVCRMRSAKTEYYWKRRRAVRMKVKKLQKLIPGGPRLKADRLLLKTAHYILLLRFQLHVLQALNKYPSLIYQQHNTNTNTS